MVVEIGTGSFTVQIMDGCLFFVTYFTKSTYFEGDSLTSDEFKAW